MTKEVSRCCWAERKRLAAEESDISSEVSRDKKQDLKGEKIWETQLHMNEHVAQ